MTQTTHWEHEVRSEVTKRRIAVANEMLVEALQILQDPRASREEKEEAQAQYHQARRLYERTV